MSLIRQSNITPDNDRRFLNESGDISYNFEYLLKGLSSIMDKDKYFRQKGVDTIKNELNKFFTDFKCTQIVISENTDNDFFGVQIIPHFAEESILHKYLSCRDNDCKIDGIRFDHYTLDFDSRLFNGDFTPYSIMAVLLHDINAINTPTIIEKYLDTMNFIAMKCGTNINTDALLSDYWLFMFTMYETIRNMTSSFEYCNEDLIFADDFINSYGLRDAYDDGMEEVKRCKNKLYDQITCPTLLLNWYLSVYKLSDETNRKSQIADIIGDSIRFCGSKSMRDIMKKVMLYSNWNMSSDERAYYDSITEAAGNKKKRSLFSQIKQNGMKAIEDDVYEYRIRLKNVETEYEAINLIRELNNRMGIIDDYLNNEDLSENEKERLYKLYNKYDNIREELSKKAIYNKKMYGLFVDYNALRQMSDANNLTMNTYY